MCSVLAHRKAFKGPVRLRGAFSVSEGGGWAPGGVGGCSGRARSAVSLCRGAAVSAGRRRLLWGPRAAERRPLTVPGASPISMAPGRARQWGGRARVTWPPGALWRGCHGVRGPRRARRCRGDGAVDGRSR